MNVTIPLHLSNDAVIILHFIVNMAIAAISGCRLGKMRGVLLRVKTQYVLMLVAAVAHAFSPVLFQQLPVGISVLFSCVVCYMLVADTYQWKTGAPREAISDFSPLTGTED